MNDFKRPIESCQKWTDSTWQQVDLAFNIFFMFYFFIRVSFKLNLTSQILFDKNLIIFIFCKTEVYSGRWQTLVLARYFLNSGLFYHTTLVCEHLFGPQLDRSAFFARSTSHEHTRHLAISKCAQDKQLNSSHPTLCHVHLDLAHSGRFHSSSKKLITVNYSQILLFFIEA